jgi:hypothetical protein
MIIIDIILNNTVLARGCLGGRVRRGIEHLIFFTKLSKL